MGDAGDYWKDVKAYEKDQEAKFWNSSEGKAYLRETRAFWRSFWKQVKDGGLTRKEFANGHNRVSDGTQSFDFWETTETVKTVNGEYRSGREVLNEQLGILLGDKNGN